MNVIELDKLTKYYGKVRGIEDVSFSVEEGDIFGFIGPNGSGKTTTIRTLLGLLFPTRGRAFIFGKDIVRHGPEIRQHIGYLPSEVFFYQGMRVRELLHYAASFYPGNHTQRIKELSEYLELDLDREVNELSFGNRKKVGIVVGLLHQPKLLFLDEPTLGLDPLKQRRFFELIQRENQEKGVTIFFSSHILSEVQRLCNKVAIIREGKIIEIADILTLRKNSYKKITVIASELASDLFQLPGIANLHIENNTASFYFKGDINEVLKRLATLKVQDVTIEDPTLEEIFIHYYS